MSDRSRRDAKLRHQVEYAAALRDVAIRLDGVEKHLQRVALWCRGKLDGRLKDDDLIALDEACRHYRRIAEVIGRSHHGA